MEGKLYCILCQDAHKMTASCLQDVQCKLCSRKGHLRKDCPQTESHSSQKRVDHSDEDLRTVGRKRKVSVEVTDTGDSSKNTSNALLKCKRKRMVSSEDECHVEDTVVISLDDDKDILNNEDSTQENTGMTEEPAEHLSKNDKIKGKTSSILKAGNCHIVSTHIELFRSNKSSSTKLTQLCCTVYGSFFRGIKPRGLEGYLDNYKLGGDLLKALHMTREDDGTFLYRSQFEIVEDDKKIICVEEKKALEDFLDFLQNYPGCVILGVDEDSVSILVKKLKEVNKNEVKELVVGFTYWKGVLKSLNADRNIDLEEYFSQTLGKDLSSHTIPEVLLTSVMDVGYKMKKHFSRDSFYKLCKRIDCLKKPKNVEFDRKAQIESVEVFSSFRPSVSATFTAEKLEQVTLSSELDSEPEETGRSVSFKCEVTARSSLSEPKEVPLVLPDVRNASCGCKIRKADFETLPLPEDLLKSSQVTQKEPNSTEMQKLHTRTNSWQKGKGKKTVNCPMCYCDRVKYSEIVSHIENVHKAKVSCLLCETCRTPVTPSGLSTHKSKCGAIYRKLMQSSRRTPSNKPLNTEPKRSSQSVPKRSSQSAGPKSSSQSGPKSSSQSQIDLPSGPDQNSESCPILNTTVTTAQNESKTSQKVKQTRGNFRARGFGPFDARGNNPMWGNFRGNMRGFGGYPFVGGNMWGNMNMRANSRPWMRGMGAMGPRGGMIRGPCMGPSPWSLGGNMGGGGGMGPQGWGPWNQRGGMGGMGLQGWATWNLGGGIGGGMGNMRGGMENNMVGNMLGMGGKMRGGMENNMVGNMLGMGGKMRGCMGGNMGGGVGGNTRGGMEGYMGGGMGGNMRGGIGGNMGGSMSGNTQSS